MGNPFQVNLRIISSEIDFSYILFEFCFRTMGAQSYVKIDFLSKAFANRFN